MSKAAAAILAAGFIVGCVILLQGSIVGTAQRFALSETAQGVMRIDTQTGETWRYNTNLLVWERLLPDP